MTAFKLIFDPNKLTFMKQKLLSTVNFFFLTDSVAYEFCHQEEVFISTFFFYRKNREFTIINFLYKKIMKILKQLK